MRNVHKGRVLHVIFPREGQATAQEKFLPFPSFQGRLVVVVLGRKKRYFPERPREEASVKPVPLGAFNKSLLDF